VIWCADHGDAVASHGGLWDKASTFIEEVARIPLAVRWPGHFMGGARVDRLVSNLDVTATMIDAAGVAIPAEMDSHSLLPLCLNPVGAMWPDHVICEHHGHVDRLPQRIILRDQYKYVAALFDSDELYDLEADPYEMANLVDVPAFADVQADLVGRLIQHMESRPRRDGSAERLLLALKTKSARVPLQVNM